MSITLGIAIGLFTRSLVKSGGDLLLNGGQSLLSLFKQELVTATAEQMPETIKNTINKLSLKRASRDRLINSSNIIDLAGIAWADLLTEQSDELASRYTEISTARELARRLDPYWFIDAITSPRATEITFELGAKEPSEQFEKSLLDSLTSVITTEIIDELQLEEDTNPRPLVEKVVSRMPERIYDLWISIPGIESRVIRLNTEEILRHVSGSADKTDLHRVLRVLSQQLIDSLNDDVFGRKSAQPNEPPILPHKSTYIEPEASLKRSRAPNKNPLEKGPTKSLIRKLWTSVPNTQLVVLHAPFGYGKSLTFKSLAADLAAEWQKNPENAPFPVLLRCPEVLSGHVSTLKAAVQSSLEKQTGLALSAVERIWSTHKLVLLLDSFDEVHMSDKAAKGWFEEMQQISNSDRVRVIVASRPHAFQSKWLGPNDWEIELQPFDENRGQRWLDAVAGRLGPTNLTFQEVSSTLDPVLAGTPILLVMAAYGWNENASSTPNSKAAIYRRFIEKISTGKWAEVQEAHQVVQHGVDVLTEFAGHNAFRKALRLLAWEYLCAEQYNQIDRDLAGLSRRHISDTLQANFSDIGDEQIDEITHSLCLSLFLHKSAGTESVVFSHRSFREYLCAEHITDALRNEFTNNHYLSLAWRLMTEARLGEAELSFSSELIQELEVGDRVRITRRLDSLYKETRSIYFKGKGGLQIEKTDTDTEIGLAPPTSDRSLVFRFNVESLSLAGRGHSFYKIVEELRASSSPFDRREHILDDDVCRVLSPLRTRSQYPGQIWAIGYHVDTGQGVFISPIIDLDAYREALKRAPDVFLPIKHISTTYFACSSPGLQVEHLIHGLNINKIKALLELGKLLKTADAAGVSVPTLGLTRPARTSNGLRLGFCAEEKANTKLWWSNRALSLATDLLFEKHRVIPRPPSHPAKQELAVELSKHLGAFLAWDTHSWDDLITKYELIIAAFYAPKTAETLNNDEDQD